MNRLGGDTITDRQTDRQTDGAKNNIPIAFFKSVGIINIKAITLAYVYKLISHAVLELQICGHSPSWASDLQNQLAQMEFVLAQIKTEK
jgi:hypothetical protein